MKKFEIVAGSILVWALPMAAMAATVDTGLTKIKDLLITIIAILFVLVTLWFIWGVIQYVSAAGEAEKLKAGKDHMIWGIIGMAVAAGAWGLVKLLLETFGVGSSGIPTVPGGF